MDTLPVDIWSDVVCPRCYVGKRRLEKALERFAHRDAVRITWHAFELDPSAPRSHEGQGSYAARLARKYGKTVAAAQAMIDQMVQTAAAEGLAFDFTIARPGNTFDAHRLLAMARARGLQNELKERLLRATFTEGQAIGERDVLARLAAEVGLDEGAARAVLESDAHGGEVREEEAQARKLGVTGVPFFVVGRRYAVGGAQAPEALLRVLERAWSEGLVEAIEEAPAPACGPDGCVV